MFTRHARIFHLSWSGGLARDDRVLHDLSRLEGTEVVATVKLDGENTSFYRDGLHARSLEFVPRVDRGELRALHASIAHEIPDGWRICGENMWAAHSCYYENLKSIFYVHSIWRSATSCLSWDETCEWAALLDLPVVPEIYRGPWNEDVLRSLHRPEHNGDPCEGYVVRVTSSFEHDLNAEALQHLAKYVRAGHVQTQAHWTKSIRPNPFVENLHGRNRPSAGATGLEHRDGR